MAPRRRLAAVLLSVFGIASAPLAAPASPAAAEDEGTRARVAEAWRLLRAGQPDAAGRELQSVLSQAPGSAEAHYVLGAVREEQKDLNAAERAYRSALRYDPDLAEAHDRLGFVLGRLGRTHLLAVRRHLEQAREALIRGLAGTRRGPVDVGDELRAVCRGGD